jgi:hypothetical protein
MRQVFAQQLLRAELRPGVEADQEALILLTVVTGMSQGVLDGQITTADAFGLIDYALDRALAGGSAGCAAAPTLPRIGDRWQRLVGECRGGGGRFCRG